MERPISFKVNIEITENNLDEQFPVVKVHSEDYVVKADTKMYVRATVNDILGIIQEKIDVLKDALPLYDSINSMEKQIKYHSALDKITTLEKLYNKIYNKYFKEN